jgi:acetyltransferase-like isoleucine patch superfamily enzyme
VASAPGALERLQYRHLRLRGQVFSFWVRARGGRVGKKLLLDKHVRVRHAPNRGWSIGDEVYIGCGAILDVRPGAELRIGTGVKVMHHVVLGVERSLTIGDYTQIAEACSIRDADHGVDGDELIVKSAMQSDPVRIGRDVWIARGCAVLRGTVIEDGAVVAANSVVRGHVASRSIVAGAPAVFKRTRGE